MTSSPHGYPGLHTCYAGHKPLPTPRGGANQTLLSSDCSLQLDCMKPESLVMAYRIDAVVTFRALYPPPVTSRK